MFKQNWQSFCPINDVGNFSLAGSTTQQPRPSDNLGEIGWVFGAHEMMGKSPQIPTSFAKSTPYHTMMKLISYDLSVIWYRNQWHLTWNRQWFPVFCQHCWSSSLAWLNGCTWHGPSDSQWQPCWAKWMKRGRWKEHRLLNQLLRMKWKLLSFFVHQVFNDFIYDCVKHEVGKYWK